MSDTQNAEISFYCRCRDAKSKKHITVKEAIQIIKSEKLKGHIAYLRVEKDKKKRTLYKSKNLPAVTFQGTFYHRKKEMLLDASGLATLDIDEYGKDLSNIKEQLKKDPYVFAFFKSPSGGLKILIKIPIVKTYEEYERIYNQIIKYYAKYGIKVDTATKDISRLCFLSYDPEVFVK